MDNVGDAAKAVKGVCFVAGTLVKTENGSVPIEGITEGMLVYAHNPDSGETELKEVVQTFVRETKELVHIKVNGEEIITTPTHPFYVPKKGWTDAIQLRAGDRLQLLNGEYVIIEQVQHEILEAPVTVYNFEVEEFHTYYVSDSGILVHNKCSGSYEIFTSNDRVYVGKGSVDRMNTSVKRLEKQGFEIVDKVWTPAANSKIAFIDEYMKMSKYGFDFEGKMINKIMSPGFKIFNEWL